MSEAKSDYSAVVLLSGGLDSSTCLAWAISEWGAGQVYPVALDYGQRHAVELEQARVVADKLGATNRVRVLDVPALHDIGGSSLTDQGIEVEVVGHDRPDRYEEPPSSFVPGRNLIFLSLAAAYAYRVGAANVVIGISEADAAGYPDCTSRFLRLSAVAMNTALGLDPTAVERMMFRAPLLDRSKAQTFKLADDLGVLDTVIEHTHTCYEGDRGARWMWGYGCGTCLACNERARGYAQFTAVRPGGDDV